MYETEIKKKHKTKKHQYIDDIGHISVHVRNVMAKKNPENINWILETMHARCWIKIEMNIFSY